MVTPCRCWWPQCSCWPGADWGSGCCSTDTWGQTSRSQVGYQDMYHDHDNHDPWPGSALVVGRGWDHWWVAAGLAHYLLIIPAIAATELPTTEPVPAPVQVRHTL